MFCAPLLTSSNADTKIIFILPFQDTEHLHRLFRLPIDGHTQVSAHHLLALYGELPICFIMP